MKKMLLYISIIIVITGILISALVFFKNKSSQNSVVLKICSFINMPSVEITSYENEKGVIGGYFAIVKDVTDPPSYLFDYKGEKIATDSFFHKQEDRLNFSNKLLSLKGLYRIEKIHKCK